MPTIKNIIFDLGGVFLDVDYNKTKDAFIALGIDQFDELYRQNYSNPLFAKLERGEIEPPAFYKGFREITGIALSDKEIRNAWNAMLGHFRQGALDLLAELAHEKNIFLFSNTNSIHHEAFHHAYAKQFHHGNFDLAFRAAYYSHIFGMRKPEPASYIELCRLENLDPAETLFVDDTLVNIDGAEAAGLWTLHLLPGMKLEEALPRFLRQAGPEN